MGSWGWLRFRKQLVSKGKIGSNKGMFICCWFVRLLVIVFSIGVLGVLYNWSRCWRICLSHCQEGVVDYRQYQVTVMINPEKIGTKCNNQNPKIKRAQIDKYKISSPTGIYRGTSTQEIITNFLVTSITKNKNY